MTVIYQRGKSFYKKFSRNGYEYEHRISHKDYVKLQLGISSYSFNQIVREFLKHIGEEYYIVQVHRHGHPYQVELYTRVKSDDGPLAWAESPQLHLAMYKLMSEVLWDAQQIALARFNSRQEQELEDVRVEPWASEATVWE